MPPLHGHNQERIEAELAALSRLHPDYSRAQLLECRDNFLHYLEFVWKIFERMKKDGRLNLLLTDIEFQSTFTSLDQPKQPPP